MATPIHSHAECGLDVKYITATESAQSANAAPRATSPSRLRISPNESSVKPKEQLGQRLTKAIVTTQNSDNATDATTKPAFVVMRAVITFVA